MRGPRRMPILTLAAAAFLAAAVVAPVAAAPADDSAWPRRVLITNDDGIDSPGIIALARAFAPFCEVWVVAPVDDRSGSGGYVTIGWGRRTFEVERRELGDGIRAYALDGYPADCVLFGLRGPMRDAPPDLIVSGINTGPNLGPYWFGSGTVGAARKAASLGLPAVAVSGFDERIPGAEVPAAEWTAALARTALVRDLPPGRYLTVSFPECPPERVRGVAITGRAPERPDHVTLYEPSAAAHPGDGRETWRAVRREGRPEPVEDQLAYGADNIVIVPMTVDEVYAPAIAELRDRIDEFPAWPVPREGVPQR